MILFSYQLGVVVFGWLGVVLGFLVIVLFCSLCCCLLSLGVASLLCFVLVVVLGGFCLLGYFLVWVCLSSD